MICEHCHSILHICPTCGEHGYFDRSRKDYRRYVCDKGHRWYERDGEVISVKRGRPATWNGRAAG